MRGPMARGVYRLRGGNQAFSEILRCSHHSQKDCLLAQGIGLQCGDLSPLCCARDGSLVSWSRQVATWESGNKLPHSIYQACSVVSRAEVE